MPDRIALILAGGMGERFWPMSRPDRPKQLLNLLDPDKTMLDQAVQRIAPIVGKENVFIGTERTLQDQIVKANVVSEDHVWAEPMRRNSLGALIWAAANGMARSPKGWRETTLAVLTSDHVIEEGEGFTSTIKSAVETAENSGGLVTIGIRPTRAETGFGYIESPGGAGPQRALRFHEKPDPQKAEEYFASGNMLWNSGMFFWTLGAFANALQEHQPEAHEIMIQLADKLESPGNAEQLEELFAKLPSISVDFALMEHASNVWVVPASFHWDDVGAWDSLDRALPKDNDGNVVVGKVLISETTNSVVVNEDPSIQVAILGMDDVIVVVSGSSVLICPKHKAQQVREVAAMANQQA